MSRRSLALLFTFCLCACTKDPSTEVVVIVRSALGSDPAYARIDVSWGGDPAQNIETECVKVGAGGVPFPLTFSLVPDGKAADPFTVHAAGYSDASCNTVISEQRARIKFYPDRRLALPLTLYPACGQQCGADQGCAQDGSCATLTTLGPDDVPPFDPNAIGGDAGTSPGTDPCASPRPEWLLCDGLDSLTTWVHDQTPSGVLAFGVDSTRKRSGTGSAHVHVRGDGVSYTSAYFTRSFNSVPVKQLYARVWVFVNPASTTLDAHLLHLNGTDGMNDVIVGAGGSAKQVYISAFGGIVPPYYVSQNSTTSVSGGLPTGWFCLEMSIELGDAITAGLGTVRINDREYQSVPLYVPQPGLVSFGLAQDQQANDWEVWFDDLVVSTAPIGCQ